MFESTKWTLEEPNVADESKYDMIVPTVVRAPESQMKKNGDHVRKKFININYSVR
jgi:cation-transporting ATPase 13A3/4/5